MSVLLLAAVSIAFFVSAAAGLGGSLVLVPILALSLGTKEGISAAALLLAGNNLVKLWAFRGTIPVRAGACVTVCALAGAWLGAHLLVSAPERLVAATVVVSCAMALAGERRARRGRSTPVSLGFAFAGGATSGFSGTSGPLKGLAVRSLAVDRMQTIGAAAMLSAATDVAKTTVFLRAGLLDGATLQLAVAAIPLMFAATFAGRQFTAAIGERGYSVLFWLVVGGYTARLMIR